MRKIAQFSLPLALACLMLPEVRADQTAPQTVSVELQRTDWTSNLVFNKFDTSLGTLTGAEFSLNGHIQGTAAYENTATASATVTLKLQADIALSGNNGATLVTTSLSKSITDHTGAFDGTIDFAGTSGKRYGNLSADKSLSVNVTDPATLSLFNGPGTMTLPLSAKGKSAASGLGNLLTQFSTESSASATLVYLYSALPSPIPAGQETGPPSPQTVPEPSSIALTVCGGLAIALGSRRRRSRAV